MFFEELSKIAKIFSKGTQEDIYVHKEKMSRTLVNSSSL